MSHLSRTLRYVGVLVLATLAAATSTVALAAGPAQAPAPASPLNVGAVHIFPTRGRAVQIGLAAASQANMTYHGGPVMHTSATYAIFWLPSGYSFDAASGGDAGYEALIQRYFGDVGNTSLYNVLTQYPDRSNPLNSSGFSAAYVDAAGFPSGRGSASNPLLDSDIQAEVARVMQAKGWSASPASMFFVFTPLNVNSCFDSSHTSCSFTDYCAYHGAFGSASDPVIYANMPDAGTNLSSCGASTSPNNDPASDSTINLTSHEHFEAVSDPQINAWYDGAGAEIGDKCAWTFGPLSNGGDVSLHGHPYIVQQEWSNAGGRCVISYGATAAVSPTLSTLGASPSTVAANNAAASTVTVTLMDTNGNPAGGKSVGLSAGSGGHSTISTLSGTTNSAGQASFAVRDGTAETVIYSAIDTSDSIPIANTATVIFTPGAPPPPGPMILSGYLSSFSYSRTTIAADVAGVPCSGASVSISYASYFSGLSLAGSCGPGAVTLFVNGEAAGLRTANGATCLPFAVGSVSGLRVLIGGAPNSSCGGASGGPPAPGAPSAPTGVTAVAGNGSATITWSAPSDGGSPITGYTVMAMPAGGDSPVLAGAAATGATVTGLTNGVAYSFNVVATNAVGTGPGATSNAVTPSGGSNGGSPMILSGYLSSFSYSRTTVAADVAGVPCSGASVSISYASYFSGLSLAGSCGPGAVTLFVNGEAAGLRTASGASCLPFAVGSVSGLRVLIGGAPNTNC